jgi:hypothetical protein
MNFTDQRDFPRIRVAVEDNAYRYIGGPFNMGAEAAVRYVCEGHLKDYPLREVWEHVAAYIDAYPQVLAYTPADVAIAQQERNERCDDLAHEAYEAMNEGDIADALALIDDAERTNPDYRVAGRHTWDDLREAINAKRPVCERCKQPALAVDRDFGVCPECVEYNASRVVI